jgi:hypothetical protein
MPTTMLTKTRVLLTAVAAAAALLALGAGSAAAAHDASQATANCWLQVVNDWEDNGRVDNVYAPPCYTQAIQHLNAYPDLKGYSSAIDDIQQALYAVLHEEGRGGGLPPSTTSSSNDKKHITGITGPGNGGNGPGGGDGFFHRIANRLAPGNAQSVPLPLLVLGGLAVLLLLAAAATWFAKRMQARRITPAPAPSPVPPPRRR